MSTHQSGGTSPKSDGPSGKIAAFFIDSKLTPLVAIVSLALGVFAIVSTPREQDPTISVPMVQVLAPWPGHEADEIDERVGREVSAWMREIPRVEHVMSASVDDGAMVTVLFPAGVTEEDALTQVNARLAQHAAERPAGALPPSVALTGSDDVPVMSIAFTSQDEDPRALRRVVRAVADIVEQLPNVATTRVLGGVRRTISVRLDPSRLAAHGIPAAVVTQTLQTVGVAMPLGEVSGAEGAFTVRGRVDVRSVDDFRDLVVAASPSGIVRLRDVAEVLDDAEEPTSYVSYVDAQDTAARSAVVLTIQKERGTNATDVTAEIERVLEGDAVRAVLGRHVAYRVARDAGRVASAKVATLLEHMLLATLIVMLVIAVTIGYRAALIVGVVIPVTLAFVPFVYGLTGFTLNRITMSAMIFAIGILVDDAIVVIENMHRRFELAGPEARTNALSIALDAVREVGAPTILATAAVIAALAPMGFVGGMMGQFMISLPIGSSVAMVYSLFVALSVTPFLAYKLLRPRGEAASHAVARPRARWLAGYTRVLAYFVARPLRAVMLGVGCIVAMVAVGGLLGARIATFRNMPLNEVDSIALLIDMPPGTTLVDTNRAATEVARAVAGFDDVDGVEVFSGVAGPLTFQGVARGYGMRAEVSQAELQIGLSTARAGTSHDMAERVRREAERLLLPSGARLTIAEEPMGPPQLGALVAEVYAPDRETRLALADAVRAGFERSEDVVDVQTSTNPTRPTLLLDFQSDRMAAHGVAGAMGAASLRTLLARERPLELSLPGEPESVLVEVRAGATERATAGELMSLTLSDVGGRPVALSELADLTQREGNGVRLRRDLVPVIFVVAEMRANGSAIYPMIDLSRELPLTPGVTEGIEVLWDDSVPDPARSSIRWGGDWTPTFEMNRDLAVAFLAACVFIYLLLAGWYGSYTTPLVVMLPIPLAIVGIVPAHVIAGLPLSGWGTMGVIALAGLMVRNSILIVDFAREKVRVGAPLESAVITAGEQRIRPILLTAATVVLGDGVLFLDPMMQGLGLTMASGALVSTILTLVAVPVSYYWLARVVERRAPKEATETPTEDSVDDAVDVVPS